MSQPPIDLLPESIRARSQAAVVAGRYIAVLLIASMLLLVPATHSRFQLESARDRMRAAEEQADLVLTAEAKASQLRDELRETRVFIDRYEHLAMPIPMSRLIATITNELPASATLDRIDLNAAGRNARGLVRRRGLRDNSESPQRLLIGELSGFAASDRDVADFVERLDSLGLCRQVSLDFSRTRNIRGRSAREFRVSFRIDLDRAYEVVDREPARASMSKTRHVQ